MNGLALPEFVLRAFEKEIEKTWDGKQSIVQQRDITHRIKETMGDYHFDVKWLDIEVSAEQSGLNVKYNKPAYYESYDPFFVFSKK